MYPNAKTLRSGQTLVYSVGLIAPPNPLKKLILSEISYHCDSLKLAYGSFNHPFIELNRPRLPG